MVIRGLSDADATRKMAQELAAHGHVGGGEFGEFLGARPGSAQAAETIIPGKVPRTAVSAAAKGFREGSVLPLSVRRQLGDVGKDPVEQKLVAMGRAVGSQVETVTRMATHIALRRQGRPLSQDSVVRIVGGQDLQAIDRLLFPVAHGIVDIVKRPCREQAACARLLG